MASNPVTSRFRIRHGDQVVALPPVGELVVGRGADCGLCLDDRAASRRHALIRTHESGEVTIEDLGSVNGVVLNGATISGRARLAHGDRIGIAASTLVFLEQGLRGAATRPRPTSVAPDAGPPDTEIALLERALERGDATEAEGAASAAVTRALRRGIDRALLGRLERALVSLVDRDGFWLERVVELRAADGSLPEPDVVARLQALARAGRPVSERVLRGYLAALAPRLEQLPTGERFTYRRLESLLRQSSDV